MFGSARAGRPVEWARWSPFRQVRELVRPRTLLGVVRRFLHDNSADTAASLAYYILLSLFPAILLMSAIADLVWSPDAFFRAAEPLLTALPTGARETVGTFVEDALQGAGGGFAVTGAIALLWASTGWFRASGRAVEAIYGTKRRRNFFSMATYGVRMVLIGMLLVVGLVAVLIGPDLLREIVDLGVMDEWLVFVWWWARWPAVLVLLVVATDLMYSSATRGAGGWRSLSPGGFVAVASWVLMTMGLSWYLRYAARTTFMYGTLSGVVALLLWSWLFNVATLLGATVNAELIRLEAEDEAKWRSATG